MDDDVGRHRYADRDLVYNMSMSGVNLNSGTYTPGLASVLNGLMTRMQEPSQQIDLSGELVTWGRHNEAPTASETEATSRNFKHPSLGFNNIQRGLLQSKVYQV